MSNKQAKRLRVLNHDGINMRRAASIVGICCKVGLNTSVTLQCVNDECIVNARSMVSILSLAAYRGVELIVEADGPEASEVIEAITQLFERKEAC